ncbi:MAG: alpha/beta hydrolase [Solirubrobacterales bacterium]|nr:alpha/beta hydrolase [Solirubrobacterales bacterium]HMT05270.1 alpha/beta hydrolase [Solirubrobacterales bacterium]
MPVGYLITVLILGLAVSLLLPRIRGPRRLGKVSFWAGMIVNEQAHWLLALLSVSTVLAFTDGDIDSAGGYVLVALAILVACGLVVLLIRSFTARKSLRESIGSLGPDTAQKIAERGRYGRVLLTPIPIRPRRVERLANIAYGPAGKRNKMDIYRPQGPQVTGPFLIYLHGGSFTSGFKRRESLAMHYRLASKGWVTVSANYRLSPESRFPENLIDLKRVIAWVREEGAGLGADPSGIFLAGSSAGGHLAAMAALTSNEPLLQPGFESADTTVAGAIGLYGYYGGLEFGNLRPRGPLSSSPLDHVAPGAPPFLIVHGDHDTIVTVANARRFASSLEEAGNSVAYAELPGAQHSFDLTRSVRFSDSIDAIEDFAAWAIRTPDTQNCADRR